MVKGRKYLELILIARTIMFFFLFYMFTWLGEENPLKGMEVQARFSLLEAPMVMTRRAQMRPKLHLVPLPPTATKCPARWICTAETGVDC
jgi:hypothetical protein